MKRFYFCILFAFLLVFSSIVHASIYDVTAYGAEGTKEQSAQAYIQQAIDECHQAGGGTIYFPAGDYYSGEIHLKSHVTLHLSAGATLWASTNPSDYSGSGSGRLLRADGVEHIAITGLGTIHGQGVADYGSRWGVPERPPFRVGVLLFENSHDITLRDITILYSDSWTVHLKRCERVVIDGIKIYNNIRRLNSDGIDPNSCRDVHISNCDIVAGDDCIVLKTTEPYPCENIVVTNCTLRTTTTAIKLGTESQGDFRDIHFSNCTIKDTRTGIGFFMKDGAMMERITFSNISIENLREEEKPLTPYPIFMDIEQRHEDSKVGIIRDIIFRDILIHSGSGILIQGMPEQAIENLTMQNITLRADWVDDYSNRKKAVGGRRTTRDFRDTTFARMPSFITLSYCNGVTLENINVLMNEKSKKETERSAFIGCEIDGLTLNNLKANLSNQKQPFIVLNQCQNGIISHCLASLEIKTYARVEGKQTYNLNFPDKVSFHEEKKIILSEEVNPEEVRY